MKHTPLFPFKATTGFTMIEFVVVIVLLGILGAMGAEFIALAFKGFHDTDQRIELYEEGKLALMRIERELQIALPNTIEVSETGDAFSFGQIDGPAMKDVFGRYSETHPVDEITDSDPTPPYLPLDTLVSIYNTTPGEFNTGERVYRVTSDGLNPMQLDGTIAAASPGHRFFAVRKEAVQFAVDESKRLVRKTVPVTTDGRQGDFETPLPLARDLEPDGSSAYFTYIAGDSSRNAVLGIHFAINRNGESVNFHKEIQVRNVP